jgi:hypothetical protein
VSLVTGLSGCITAVEDQGEEVNGTEQSLNGTVIYDDSSCNAQKATINAAMATALANINDARMVDCLRDAIISYTEYGFAEQLLSQVRENMPTHVRCANLSGANASAPIEVSTETLTYDLNFLATNTVASIAATTVHEVSHNKSYRHPSDDNDGAALDNLAAVEYKASPPEQIEQCSRSISSGAAPARANGRARDVLVNETTLAPTGRDGGSAFEIACPAGQLAAGVQARAGTEIDAVGLGCRVPGSGAVSHTTLSGGSGGTLFHLDCQAGEVMVGVTGRAATRNDAVGPICATLAQVQVGGSQVFRDPTVGGSGGVAYERLCPPFMAVRAVKGKSATKVDRLELECQTVNRIETVSEQLLSDRCGTGGSLTLEKCAGRAALTGLTYQTGARVDRVGGLCTQVTTTCASGVCTDSVSGATHMLPAHGGIGGAVAEDRCAAGSVLVGLRVRSGSKVDAVGAVCASASAWSGTGAATTTNLSLRGGTGGSLTTVTCARGSFLTGWRIRSGSDVDAIQAVCRNFN